LTEIAFWILTALSRGIRHGYAVLTDVKELSDGAVVLRVTTLYASLERLERDGRIDIAREEVVDGRARRYYEITEDGREQLAAEAELLAQRAAVAKSSIASQPARTRAATVSTITALAVTA
jgi:DNA-binding PadR family transcriptional regulator